MAGCLKRNGTFGIGNTNSLPWKCKEELQLFKRKTMNHTLITGRKTYETLPILPHRKLIVVSNNLHRHHSDVDEDDYATFSDNIDKVLRTCPDQSFIIGGASIYQHVFNKYTGNINKFYLSVMKKDYECDTFVHVSFPDFNIIEKEEFNEFTHYVLEPCTNGETQYLSLLKDVILNGDERQTRNSVTKSTFGKSLTFDLQDGFPLLTTKKMFLKGIIEELLFFLRGETNSKILEEKNVNIWKGNTSREFLDKNGFEHRKEGMMGAMYGFQLRHFNAEYDEETGRNKTEGFDQLKYVVDLIQNDPNSRRILMTSFNPIQADNGVLYPCHSIVCKFYCNSNDLIDLCVYNRSQDLFHGVPFNIASSALLLCIIAKLCHKKPVKLIMNLGDCHIYQSHYEVVQEQLTRFKCPLPKLVITKELNTLNDIHHLVFEDFRLENYVCHSPLKADMVA